MIREGLDSREMGSRVEDVIVGLGLGELWDLRVDDVVSSLGDEEIWCDVGFESRFEIGMVMVKGRKL